MYRLVRVDTTAITDWPTFHDVFTRAFGFPEFYGRNMNAWIDCMTSLDAPEHGLTAVHAPAGGLVVVELIAMREFQTRCPELALAIQECSAFVNWRRIAAGEDPILALSYR